jgi:protoporphyrinogen/coproporphyrinogen III oxidase
MTAQQVSRQPAAAVVGAGLAGLTAGFRLRQAGWRVTVFEASGRAGGRVQTVRREGFLIDTGASALAQSYSAYFSLAEELGLRQEIELSSACIGIFRKGRVHELHLDRMIRSALTTSVLSWRSKARLLRLGADILSAKLRGYLDYSDMRRAAALDTETARDYALRVLNVEIDEFLGSPVIRTMLIANTDAVSKVELFSGIANIFSARLSALRGGQGRLTARLAELVNPKLNCKVSRVAEVSGGVEVQSVLEGALPTLERFDACVVCCPLPVAASICRDKAELLAPLNHALTYTQAITVAVGTRRRPHSQAMLIQIPACEDSNVALMFLDHNKARDRAPAGKGLISCQWENLSSRRMMKASDASIIECTLQSVFRVFPELKDAVEFTHVTRWPLALPLTNVGAYRKIGDFNAGVDAASRIQFAGDYMGEAGQNTVVQLGNAAADNFVKSWASWSQSLQGQAAKVAHRGQVDAS